jgi:DNA-nicking Smr family endonuclease
MDEEAVPMPITGELDLHTFRPRDVKDLVPEYLVECRRRGILTVRIVHGKGIGNLRRTVHALLERDPTVESFTMAGSQMGTWGATMVKLRPSDSAPE